MNVIFRRPVRRYDFIKIFPHSARTRAVCVVYIKRPMMFTHWEFKDERKVTDASNHSFTLGWQVYTLTFADNVKWQDVSWKFTHEIQWKRGEAEFNEPFALQ